MKTVHIISHTHWDREWYRTFQQFRLKLVHLVDGLLDILATDKNYKHFMLDGQTIVLDDYLLMRPDTEPTLKRLIQSGRLLIGPWHILPDMFLVSPEAHIRNLLAGHREAKRFGPKMMIGYMPDSFGHIGQMPQILRGFGIDNACLWRGLDDQPAEFWWKAPDGSRVLMMYLRDSYSNGASLDAANPERFTEQVKRAADSLAPHSAASHLLLMFGTDHMEPPRETSNAIAFANKQLKEYRLLHSTLPEYLYQIQSEAFGSKVEIPIVTGELRSSKRSHLLPGVLSTRMWIKQRNHASENLLEKWAEPFSTFASWNKESLSHSKHLANPSSILREAWQLLMECHPHDSICGCSIDQVHDEMLPRFDQVDQIGEEITKQSLEILSGAVNTSGQSSVSGNQAAVVVFNPLSAPRTDIVTAEISLPSGTSDFEIVDEVGNTVPHQSASGKTTDLLNVRVAREELGGLLSMVNDGRAANLAVQDLIFKRDGAILNVEAIFSETAPPKLDVWDSGLKEFTGYINDTSIETFQIHARSPESASITFAAGDVPALGWKTFYIRGKENVPTEMKVTPMVRLLAPLAGSPFAQKLIMNLSQPKTRPPYIIENGLFSVELDQADRTLTVTEKATGKVYRGLNRFVDGGDCGDEYNFSPPASDSLQNLPTLREVNITRGSVQQVMTVSLTLTVPESLSADRKSRSTKTVELPIITTITLAHGVPRVDVRTRVDNHAKDHRLRVHFPFMDSKVSRHSTEQSLQTLQSIYDGHFEVIQRPIGLPKYDSTWAEEPRPETHQRAFTAVRADGQSLTIANRGLPEVEVTPQSEIALTLLRCVGWLSRDDFATRTNHAGPFLETPKAQMPGVWDFDYSIIINGENQQAWNFDVPLRAALTDVHAGTLPANGSFVNVDSLSFVVSAVKETDDGRGWVVRGYNVSGEDVDVTLTPWRKFKKAERVAMSEETVSKLKVGGSGEVKVTTRAHEVVTVMFG